MWDRYKPLMAAWASGWILPFALFRFSAGGEDVWRGGVSLLVGAFFLLMAISLQKEAAKY